MSYYTGSQTAAAGATITVLDTELVKNSNWSIYDASVGTNWKTYKCGTAGSVFYLSVDDNQSDYSIVRMWEDWDAVNHVGVGINTADGLMWRKLASTTYYINLNDTRLIYRPKGTTDGTRYGYYAGQPNRYNTSMNTPLLMCNVHPTVIGNVLAMLGTCNATYGGTWHYLNIPGKFVTHAFSYWSDGSTTPIGASFCKTYAGVFYVHEEPIVCYKNKVFIGTLDGVMSLGYSSAARGVVHGDTVTIDSVIWDVYGPSDWLCLVERV